MCRKVRLLQGSHCQSAHDFAPEPLHTRGKTEPNSHRRLVSTLCGATPSVKSRLLLARYREAALYTTRFEHEMCLHESAGLPQVLFQCIRQAWERQTKWCGWGQVSG
uniref:Uncharacterized protein n=1 Tax=Cacopsylla melanoneura TaxID=428564 RepID=A0A8D8PWN2_9HEMI